MEHHRLSELRREGKAYFEFLRTGDLSAGVYRLPAGGQDIQEPHNEDEIYFVVAGKARFTAGDRDNEVAAGDVLFVPAKESHRFHSVDEDLELLVFFGPAEGSR